MADELKGEPRRRDADAERTGKVTPSFADTNIANTEEQQTDDRRTPPGQTDITGEAFTAEHPERHTTDSVRAPAGEEEREPREPR